MVKSELIQFLSAKGDLAESQAEIGVDIFFDSILQALLDGERVEIRGFGAFSIREYEAYEGRNPKTGKKIFVPKKVLPFWRTGLELRQRVNNTEVMGGSFDEDDEGDED